MKEKSRPETALKGGDVTDCKRLQGMTRRSSLRRCRLKPLSEIRQEACRLGRDSRVRGKGYRIIIPVPYEWVASSKRRKKDGSIRRPIRVVTRIARLSVPE